ncbi:MAG: hypothetical protein JWR26_2672 [Pedosphaera sp.]|nr:hypothetical protein [Pedosphaera sp.]
MKKLFKHSAFLLTLCLSPMICHAWDYEGHRTVNQLALVSLPSDFPAFALTPAAEERIAFLAGEPDRWRNTTDPTLKHANGVDHYMDLEDMADYGVDMHAMTHFRYEFAGQLALARAAHPEKFARIDPAKNEDHTRELVGFLPWAIMENFDKLKSEFSYLKAFQEGGGTPEEISNAQQNIIYIMGVMGHYVGDASQPLHTTKHHHGWVGENPKGYNTESRFHSWIDGGYFAKTGGIDLKSIQGFIHPAQLVSLAYPNETSGDTFAMVTDYLLETYKLVEPLYEMDKAGKLSGEGATGLEGKTFLDGQLVKAGQMLGNLWFTAWQQAPADTFLKSTLARRKLAQAGAADKK